MVDYAGITTIPSNPNMDSLKDLIWCKTQNNFICQIQERNNSEDPENLNPAIEDSHCPCLFTEGMIGTHTIIIPVK